MMKPSVGEITGLKTALIKVKILLFFTILAPGIFPQVPINGFCKYSSFTVDSGYTKLVSANFNGDSYSDLILFNPSKKSYLAVSGAEGGKFTKPGKFNSPLEFSRMQAVYNKNNHVTGYAFSSRKERKTGILSFNNNGGIRIESTIKFNSFPDRISTSDINLDGTGEVLVSGAAFDGLSILSLSGGKLKESKIGYKTASFNYALFTDLNGDGFPDVAALNIAGNSFMFFYNRGDGSYYLARTEPLNERITFFTAYDLNLDYSQDLILGRKNGIEIYYGDYSASYKNVKVISTKYTPDKIIYGDFNKDGRMDLAYASYGSGIVSVIFAKDEKTFYPEVVYFQKQDLSDIIPFYSKFISGFAACGKNGRFYIVTNVASFTEEVSLAAGIVPSMLSSFSGANGLTGYSFLNVKENKLNIIMPGNSGIPAILIPVTLYDSHTDYSVLPLPGNKASFYCFSPGKKYVEIITIDLKRFGVERNSLYAPGGIENLQVKGKNGEAIIYITYKKGDNLYSSYFYKNKSSYTVAPEKRLGKNILSTVFSLTEPDSVFYWENNSEAVAFVKSPLETYNRSSSSLFKKNEVSSVFPYYDYFISSASKTPLSIVKDGILKTVLSAEKNYINSLPEVEILNKNDIFISQSKNRISKVYINSASDSCLYRLDYKNKGKSLNLTRITGTGSVESFFIKKMDPRKIHFAYINKPENIITIKPL